MASDYASRGAMLKPPTRIVRTQRHTAAARDQVGMQAAEVRRAVAAAMSSANALGLSVADASVLNDSNRLVVRLVPCDVVVRMAPVAYPGAQLEVEVARRLADTDSPVAALDPRVEPRVYERDGFAFTFWTYHDPAASQDVAPADYARKLARLHARLRQIDAAPPIAAPHVMARVNDTQHVVASRDMTPDLSDADRELLAETLRRLGRSVGERGAPDQLLHGEPHPWNILMTTRGPLFIDFENAARGPVEYDLAWVPEEVSALYPGADHDLIDECRGIMLAIVAAWRWRCDDEHPSGREGGVAYVRALRDGPPWPSIVRW